MEEVPHLIRGISVDSSLALLSGARAHGARSVIPSMDEPPHAPSMIGMATFNSTFHGLPSAMAEPEQKLLGMPTSKSVGSFPIAKQLGEGRRPGADSQQEGSTVGESGAHSLARVGEHVSLSADTTPTGARDFEMLFGRSDDLDFGRYAPRARKNASAFDHLFGGRATVSPRDSPHMGDRGDREGSASSKGRPGGVTDLVIPAEKMADPSDDPMQVDRLSPETILSGASG